MTQFRAKMLFLIPSVFGTYCLIQGLMLLGSENFLISGLGIVLLLWVPGCGYHSWKMRKAFAKAAGALPVAIPAGCPPTADAMELARLCEALGNSTPVTYHSESEAVVR